MFKESGLHKHEKFPELRRHHVLRSEGPGRPEHTTVNAEPIRTIVRATFGDVILLHGDDGKYLVVKDFRGDEEMAIHSYAVHRDLVQGGVPTFAFYCLETGEKEGDKQDKVLMPYIGTPELDFKKPKEGNELCVGPLQDSEAMKVLQQNGFRWTVHDLDTLTEDARKIVDGSIVHPIDLAHDSLFFKIRFQNGAWTPTGIIVGDFDAVNLIDAEEGMDIVQLRAKNRRAVIGSIYSLLSDVKNVGELGVDAAISKVEHMLDHRETPAMLDLNKVTGWDEL